MKCGGERGTTSHACDRTPIDGHEVNIATRHASVIDATRTRTVATGNTLRLTNHRLSRAVYLTVVFDSLRAYSALSCFRVNACTNTTLCMRCFFSPLYDAIMPFVAVNSRWRKRDCRRMFLTSLFSDRLLACKWQLIVFQSKHGRESTCCASISLSHCAVAN